MDGKTSRIKRFLRAWAGLGLGGISLFALTACATTQQAAVKDGTCRFLTNECNLLTAGAEGQARLRYVNPAAQWTQYKKVMIPPVAFFGDAKTKISASDQQTLVNYFHRVLQEQLAKKFEVVDEAGPGVLKLEVALNDAEAATPGLRSVSMVVPQARLLGSVKALSTGTYPFVGGAQAEARVTDAATGQLLAAAMDRRVGGGSMEAAAQWQWGDAENAMNAWAEQTVNRLYSWTSGAAKP